MKYVAFLSPVHRHLKEIEQLDLFVLPLIQVGFISLVCCSTFKSREKKMPIDKHIFSHSYFQVNTN